MLLNSLDLLNLQTQLRSIFTENKRGFVRRTRMWSASVRKQKLNTNNINFELEAVWYESLEVILYQTFVTNKQKNKLTDSERMSITLSVCLSVYQSVSQAVSHSISRSVSQSVCLSVVFFVFRYLIYEYFQILAPNSAKFKNRYG